MKALERPTRLKHANNPTGELLKTFCRLHRYNQIQKQRKKLWR